MLSWHNQAMKRLAALNLHHSLFHSFAPFFFLPLPQLMEAWQRSLSIKKDDKALSNPSKMRVDLRFYSELIAVGVFALKVRKEGRGKIRTKNSFIQFQSTISLLTVIC